MPVILILCYNKRAGPYHKILYIKEINGKVFTLNGSRFVYIVINWFKNESILLYVYCCDCGSYMHVTFKNCQRLFITQLINNKRSPVDV